jgi:hypothetical protein
MTRANVTQVMALLRLAPEIHEHILSMPETVGWPSVTERILRPIAKLGDAEEQIQAFQALAEVARLSCKHKGPTGGRVASSVAVRDVEFGFKSFRHVFLK